MKIVLCKNYFKIHINLKMFRLKVTSQTYSLFPLDEKEKYDPTNFRDQIVNGLNEVNSDLEQVLKLFISKGHSCVLIIIYLCSPIVSKNMPNFYSTDI